MSESSSHPAHRHRQIRGQFLRGTPPAAAAAERTRHDPDMNLGIGFSPAA
jgi:hypothetical protein